MSGFDPKNWYWIVASDQTQAYSSASGTFVSAADTTFVAWKAAGKTPTNIDSNASLGDALAPYQIRPVHAGVLDGYTTSQASTVISHVAFKILFNHENRLRAVERNLALNGSPANLTAQQALAAVKALM